MNTLTIAEGRTLILALAVGAIVGVLFGGWIMMAAQKLLLSVIKLAMLGVVIYVAVFLWKEYEALRRNRYSAISDQSQPTSYPPSTRDGRWWEK